MCPAGILYTLWGLPFSATPPHGDSRCKTASHSAPPNWEWVHPHNKLPWCGPSGALHGWVANPASPHLPSATFFRLKHPNEPRPHFSFAHTENLSCICLPRCLNGLPPIIPHISPPHNNLLNATSPSLCSLSLLPSCTVFAWILTSCPHVGSFSCEKVLSFLLLQTMNLPWHWSVTFIGSSPWGPHVIMWVWEFLSQWTDMTPLWVKYIVRKSLSTGLEVSLWYCTRNLTLK